MTNTVLRVTVDTGKIRSWCGENGVSLREFCRRIPVHRQCVPAWDRGVSPSLWTRQRIMEITGLSHSELFSSADGTQSGRVTVPRSDVIYDA